MDNEPITIAVESDMTVGQAVTIYGTAADSSVVDHAGKILGLARDDAAEGEEVEIHTDGPFEMEGFEPGAVLWVGQNGEITDIIPTRGFQQRAGIALSDTIVLIKFGEPLVLA